MPIGNLGMMKRIFVTSLARGLLLPAILLLLATNLLAQDNFGSGSSGPDELNFSSPTNNETALSNSGDVSSVPDLMVDWREKGAVTKVKNQGSGCDSSWAFSTTGALEGWAKIKKGHLPSLSEQELIDCDNLAGANGCDGGNPEAGLMYAMQNGLCLESAYHYTGRPGKCKRCLQPHDKPAQIFQVQKNDEAMLLEQVKKQPVAVMLDGQSLSSYRSGIMTGACGKQLDTGALVVGFGSEGPIDYWLVKTSFGESWGEKGYIRLVRNKNECGIAEFAVFPALQ